MNIEHLSIYLGLLKVFFHSVVQFSDHNFTLILKHSFLRILLLLILMSIELFSQFCIIYFYVLILHPVTLLNLFISSYHYLVNLGIFYIKIISPPNGDILPYPCNMNVFYGWKFQYNVEEKWWGQTPLFFLILEEMHSPLSMMLAFSFLVLLYIRLRKFSSIPSLQSMFYYERVSKSVKCLFCIYEIIMQFFIFSQLIWCVTLFLEVKPPLHLQDELHFIMLYNVFICC